VINANAVLGLILARGGSKGLPGKNLRPLRGKPLIGWTIEAAKQSRVLDALVLSTDAADIGAAGRSLGAEVPFMRPPELASDTATSIDAIVHALNWLAERGRSFEYLVLLEPTSPLREAADIDAAIAKLESTGAEAVVSVARAESVHLLSCISSPITTCCGPS
jgi:CMP-N,N'-diacetyllegionaminic acid synthase